MNYFRFSYIPLFTYMLPLNIDSKWGWLQRYWVCCKNITTRFTFSLESKLSLISFFASHVYLKNSDIKLFCWCIMPVRKSYISHIHYSDVIMSTMASQITSHTSVYSTVCSDADQRKHQNSASLAFVRGIYLWPVNSPHKGPVTRKRFPFDDVIMSSTKSALIPGN